MSSDGRTMQASGFRLATDRRTAQMLLTESHALPEQRCSRSSRIDSSELHRDLLPPFGSPPWQSIRSNFRLSGGANRDKKPSFDSVPFWLVVTADSPESCVTTSVSASLRVIVTNESAN